MANKLSKKDLKYLGTVAGKLVPTYYIANRKSYIKGSVLIEQGTTEIKGVKVDPKNTYIQSEPWKFPVNHYKRIIKVFKSEGVEGIKRYVTELSQLNPKPIDLGSRLI